MQRGLRTLIPGLLLVIASTATAQQPVLVVDGGKGFQNVGEAINAVTTPRATILVRDGNYPGFTINGQGISVVAAPGATVIVDDTVVVQDAVSPDGIVLRGLRFDPPAGRLDLEVRDSEMTVPGTATTSGVWVDHCVSVTGRGGGLLVDMHAHVTVTGCTFEGDEGGGPGGDFDNGNVFCYQSVFKGAASEPGIDVLVNTGMPVTYLGGCRLEGGPSGGSALRVDGLGYEVRVMDTQLLPTGGEEAVETVPNSRGFVDLLPGSMPRLEVPLPAFSPSTPRISVTGLPNELALLLVGTSQAPALFFCPCVNNALLAASPVHSIFVGIIPASGRLTMAPLQPPIGPMGRNVLHLYFQLMTVDVIAGAVRVGAGASLTVLNSRFDEFDF